MDVLDVDNAEHQAIMQDDERGIGEPPVELTINELIDNMIVEGVMDKRVFVILTQLNHNARVTVARLNELEAAVTTPKTATAATPAAGKTKT